jgi:WD40 repeat protein
LRYHAFISYSHAADGMLAPALQAGLQRLAKPWFRLPVIKIFRDQTSLSANPALWSEIERNLDASEYFVLMASDVAARSVWVQRELAWWMANRPIERVLIVVTDGEIRWNSDTTDFDWPVTTCLPMNLKGSFREEPLYVDMRWAHGRNDLSLRHAQFRAGILNLAAPLHGRPKDELDSEDIRQHRRLRAASWSAVGAIAVLAMGATIAAFIAVQNANRAVRNAITAISRQYAVESQLRIRDGRLGEAMVSGLKAIRTDDTMEARTAVFEVLQASWDFHAVLRLHNAPVRAATFRSEGKELLTWSTDNTLVVWDVARRQPTGKPLHGEPVDIQCAAFSPDGRLLATGTAGGIVILWDTGTLKRRQEFPVGGVGAITSLAFNADGTRLASGYSIDGTIVVWDLVSSTRVAVDFARDDLSHDSSVSGLSFSKDGRYLAAANWNPGSSVAVWKLATGGLVATLSPSSSFWVNDSVAFLSGNEGGNEPANYLVTGSSEGAVQLYRQTEDSRTPFQHIRTSLQNQGRIPVITGGDGVLAAGGGDGLVSVWSQLAGEPVIPASWAKASVESLAFSPNAEYLAAGTADGTVILYHGRLERPRPLESLTLTAGYERSPDGKWELIRHGDNLISIENTQSSGAGLDGLFADASFSANSHWLVTKSSQGTRLWDLAEQPPKQGPPIEQEDSRTYFSPTSNFLVSQTFQSPTHVWELTRSPLIGDSLGPDSNGIIRGYSPDGKLLLILSEKGVVAWDLASRKPVSLPIPLEPLGEDDKRRIEFSPDSRWLLTGKAGGLLSLHRIAAGEPFPVKRFYGGLFSPDGKWLVLYAAGGPENVWNLDSLSSIYDSRVKASRDFSFSDDGRWLIAKSREGNVQLWDLKSKKPTARVLPVQNVKQVAITRDGRWLVTTGNDQTSIWDSTTLKQRGPLLPVSLLHAYAFSPDSRLLGADGSEGIGLENDRQCDKHTPFQQLFEKYLEIRNVSDD